MSEAKMRYRQQKETLNFSLETDATQIQAEDRCTYIGAQPVRGKHPLQPNVNVRVVSVDTTKQTARVEYGSGLFRQYANVDLKNLQVLPSGNDREESN